MKAFSSEEGKQLYVASYDKSLSMWPVPHTQMYIDTSFGQTHVIEAGTPGKPPLVLMHGMTVSSTMWAPNIEAWAPHFHIFVIDTMGDFGKSLPTTIPRTRKDYTDWYIECLDTLGLEQVNVAGMSYGAWLSFCTAQAHPERFKRIAVAAPAASFQPMDWYFIFRSIPLLLFPSHKTVDRYMRWAAVEDVEGITEPFFSQLIEQLYIGWKYAKHRPKVLPAAFSDEECKRILTPTLLILGPQEKIYNPNKAIARAEALVPNIKTKLLSRGSHDLTLVQAPTINQEMLEFFQS